MPASLTGKPLRELPSELRSAADDAIKNPPASTLSGGSLEFAPLDHLAIAVPNQRVFLEGYLNLINAGAQPVEPPHLWPDDVPGCPPVPEKHKKHMAVVRVGSFMVVLLCSANKGDLIDMRVRDAKEAVVHHLAFRVPDIHLSLGETLKDPAMQQVTVLAEDPPFLSQVFVRDRRDPRIVELIVRQVDSDVTFTCKNIQILTEGEAACGR